MTTVAGASSPASQTAMASQAAEGAAPPAAAAGTSTLSIVVEFSGGLEMLFANQKRLELAIPSTDEDGSPATIAFLIRYLCSHAMRDSRKELFVLDGHLRPGILVLINDADWELVEEERYEIQADDNILFVSTLHGG